MASAAILNAIWDLWAKIKQKPLWKLLVDLTPEEVSIGGFNLLGYDYPPIVCYWKYGHG